MPGVAAAGGGGGRLLEQVSEGGVCEAEHLLAARAEARPAPGQLQRTAGRAHSLEHRFPEVGDVGALEVDGAVVGAEGVEDRGLLVVSGQLGLPLHHAVILPAHARLVLPLLPAHRLLVDKGLL